MKVLRKTAVGVLVLLYLFAFFAAPARYTAVFFDGVSLWAVSVLPSIFPFLLATALLSAIGATERAAKLLSPLARRLFRISGLGGSLFVLSACSGYPVGSKLLSECLDRHSLSRAEGEKLAPLLSSCGPMFLLGCVGTSLFHSRKIGWVLLAANLAAVVLSGVLLRGRRGGSADALPEQAPVSFSEIVLSSVLSVLSVGALIAVFYTLSAMLLDSRILSPLPPQLRDVLAGLVEMTSGCRRLAAKTKLSVALCAFLVTFGGACVLLQQITFLSGRVRILPFLGVKLLQGGIAFLVALSICPDDF